MCRRIMLALLTVFALLLLGAGVVVYNVTRPQPGSSNVQSAPALSPEAVRERAMETLERLEQQFHEPLPAPSPASPNAQPSPRAAPSRQRFEIRVTEQEANNLIRNLPEVRRITEQQQIRNLRVRFSEGRLNAAAQVPVRQGWNVRVSATGQVAVREGRIVYETEQVRVGDFPAPKPVHELLDRQLKAGFNKLNKQVAGRVESIELQPELLIVRGRREP